MLESLNKTAHTLSQEDYLAKSAKYFQIVYGVPWSSGRMAGEHRDLVEAELKRSSGYFVSWRSVIEYPDLAEQYDVLTDLPNSPFSSM